MNCKFLTMRQITEILRLHSNGCKISDIHRACGVSHKAVRSYIAKAAAFNISYKDISELSYDEVYKLFFPENSSSEKLKTQPDWNYIHKEMQKKSVTLQLLWEEFIEQHPEGCGYSQFCFHYYEWKKKLDLSMRQTHKLGEKCFVDFAGQTVGITNQYTGEIKCAQIFVATLGASNYTFAYAVWSQSLLDWIDCHVRMLEYFSGVPEVIVPDNLKSGVNKPCRYEPEINRTYHDFAMHYNVAVIPARVRKPQDKGKVEVSVQIVERWILAALRNHIFFSLDELNKEISILLEKLNKRPFKKLPGSRYQIFEEKEKKCLKPLPLERYELCEWKKARVNIDYHIELDGHYYSVPYKYVREEVELCFSKSIVSVLKNNKVIARHPRSNDKGKHTTIKEHMPKSHQEYGDWSPTRIINWAQSIGPSTRNLVEKLLLSRKYPATAYRSAMGIISLSKRYGKERSENAAKRALSFGAYSYRSIESILKNNLDKKEHQKTEDNYSGKVIPFHRNIRGREAFVCDGESISSNTNKKEEEKTC